MTKLLHSLAPLAVLAATAGCAVIPDAPLVEGVPAAPDTAVALGQPVQVGSVVATPIKVVEDSRCPINARCIWPGRLVVATRIDGAGWRDTADLTLGEPFGTHDVVIALVSGEPGRMAGADEDIPPAAYRFTFEPREPAPR